MICANWEKQLFELLLTIPLLIYLILLDFVLTEFSEMEEETRNFPEIQKKFRKKYNYYSKNSHALDHQKLFARLIILLWFADYGSFWKNQLIHMFTLKKSTDGRLVITCPSRITAGTG